MFRSLASVGIIAILGAAGVWSAVGQEASNQETSEGVVVKNHMSDQERDRLMREAMEKARVEMEAQKAKEASAAAKAAEKEKQKEATRLAAEAAEEKLEQQKNAKTAADSESKKTGEAAAKAEQEKLAQKLAEEEKAPSAYSADQLRPLTPADKPLNLDSVKKNDSAAAKAEAELKKEIPAKKTASTEAKKSTEPKKSDTEKKPEIADKKPDSSTAKQGSDEVDKGAPEPKVVVEKVATKDPDANLTVKASASRSGEPRDAEKEINFEKNVAAGADGADRSSGGADSVEGQVVGLMRSNGKPRILVRENTGRMVQVVLEGNGLDVPAPSSIVSIHGRHVGGANGREVLSASSVKIKSGTSLEEPKAPKSSRVSVVEEETVETIGVPPMQVMGPPMGMMPPPMPMIPGMMMPPPPPFR